MPHLSCAVSSATHASRLRLPAAIPAWYQHNRLVCLVPRLPSPLLLQFASRLFKCLVSFLLDIEDEPEWHSAEDERHEHDGGWAAGLVV